MDKIYVIFGGCYSDWYHEGFFDNKKDAEMWCAIKNKQCGNNEYYYNEISKVNSEFKKQKLNYRHEVVFDFKTGIRNEPSEYEYSINGFEEDEVSISPWFKKSYITFKINCKEREKAEKIASDRYAEFKYIYNEVGNYEKAIELLCKNK